MKKLINKIFRFEVIDGDGLCPAYLFRWTLLSVFGWKFYLHHFVGDDWAADPHDHPKRFISIGLKGWYYEDEYYYRIKDGQLCYKTIKWKAPWFRSFDTQHMHRIRASASGSCWTLVIVGPSTREWGFITPKKWIEWRDYVWGGHYRKSC